MYYVLVGNYGLYGWEDLTAEETLKEIKERQKEYRENEPETSTKIVRRKDEVV